MNAITLRNLPTDVRKLVQQRAVRKHISINKAVIEILAERLADTRRKHPLFHDLDHLSGVWSKEEARSFDQAVARQRALDPELW